MCDVARSDYRFGRRDGSVDTRWIGFFSVCSFSENTLQRPGGGGHSRSRCPIEIQWKSRTPVWSCGQCPCCGRSLAGFCPAQQRLDHGCLYGFKTSAPGPPRTREVSSRPVQREPAVACLTTFSRSSIPSREALREAVERVDANTAPAYFAVNCAHPSHFEACFADAGAWTTRIRGIRANASTRSHADWILRPSWTSVAHPN